MSRTLGNIQQNENNSGNESENEPFYLKDQLPMFLAHNENHVKDTENIDEDMAKCKLLIEQLCDNQIKTKSTLEEIQQSIQEERHLDKGMCYYAAKNLVFMEYLILLKLYELLKINGKTVTSGNGLELYKRLAYLKTLLLKLQPVEKKLEYQKNKILKHADRAVVTKESKKEENSEDDQVEVEEEESDASEAINGKNKKEEESIEEEEQEEDEMAFKPRPAALMKVKQEKDIRLNRNEKYEAPKISSNLSKEDKMKQRMERQKEIRKLNLIRRLQSDLIQDDRAQESFLGDEINEKFKRKFQEKINYEEDAFVRVPDSKKDKFYMKQAIRNSTRRNQLDEDFKEVQMVRQLFEEENKMENKILHEKRKHSKLNEKSNENLTEERNQNPKKIKKIAKK